MYSGNMGMDSHDMMDIDSWRPRIALSMSYKSGSQPPSIGDVRQIDVSEPSSGIPMDSDGQPPSVNDVGRREASQSEASFTRYEGPDALEVQQHNLELQLACDGYLFNSSAIQIDFNDIPEDPCEQVYKEMETAGRLRWMNDLHPNIRRGNFSYEEKEKIIQLHSELGNKWSTIAAHLPGRSDDEIKNFVFLRWLLQKFSEIQHRTDSDLVSLTNTLGRKPSCEKNDGLRKGQWTVEEDLMLVRCINQYGFANWRKLSKYAGFKEVETAAG